MQLLWTCKNGFNLSKKFFTPKSTTFIPKINSKIRVDADHLKDNLNNFIILDAKITQEFMGGHIQNSKLISFTDGIAYDRKLFQSKDFLETLFSQNNVSKESEIVCYCIMVIEHLVYFYN